ncbi:hypothetical protein HYV86_06220 [Candidatus Woesearchaeota archaeon]|nr:hypothetical protein [Candidatus Woesearchaeota archaeon]
MKNIIFVALIATMLLLIGCTQPQPETAPEGVDAEDYANAPEAEDGAIAGNAKATGSTCTTTASGIVYRGKVYAKECTGNTKMKYSCVSGKFSSTACTAASAPVAAPPQPAPSAPCEGTVPANAEICAGDETTGVPAGVKRAAVAACTDARKCEYTCRPNFVFDRGVCVAAAPAPVAEFCRPVGPGRVETNVGVQNTQCQNNQWTNYTCSGNAAAPIQGQCPDAWLSANLGCNAQGSQCCNILVHQARSSFVQNVRCEGNVFMNETSTTCGMVTLSHDCGARGCLIEAPAGANQWWRAGCQ